MNTTTLTINVNIATGNKYEGNASFTLTLPNEDYLRLLDRNTLASELDSLFNKAIKEYNEKNK